MEGTSEGTSAWTVETYFLSNCHDRFSRVAGDGYVLGVGVRTSVVGRFGANLPRLSKTGKIASATMPAATQPLQSLSSKLVKSRHSLHATNLQCEQGRAECERSKHDVEANDALITQLEEQERKLKMQCALAPAPRRAGRPRRGVAVDRASHLRKRTHRPARLLSRT